MKVVSGSVQDQRATLDLLVLEGLIGPLAGPLAGSLAGWSLLARLAG